MSTAEVIATGQTPVYQAGYHTNLTMTTDGSLRVSVTAGGGGGGSDPAASLTGTPVPTYAIYNGYSNGAGTLVGVSPTNPMPVTLTGSSTVTLAAGTAAVGTFALSAGGSIALATGTSNIGTVAVSGLTSGTGTTGVAVPATGDYLAFSGAGGTLTGVSAAAPLPVTTSGTVALAASSTVTLAAGASNVGTFTDGSFVAQGSTTAGQVGPLVQGAVLTGNPALTTGQTAPLSLTTTGQLRTTVYNSAGTAFATAPTAGGAIVAGVAQIAAGMFFTTPIALTNGQGSPVALATTGATFGDSESLKASFSVSGTVTLAATPTDVIVIPASSTKTVRIKRIRLYASATTAGQMTMSVIRRGAANTGGTTTTPNPVAHNTVLASATAVPVFYTVNATSLGAVGAPGGPIDTAFISFGLNAAGPIYDETYGTENTGALVLTAGSAQNIAINLGGGAVPAGGTFAFRVTYTEE